MTQYYNPTDSQAYRPGMYSNDGLPPLDPMPPMPPMPPNNLNPEMDHGLRQNPYKRGEQNTRDVAAGLVKGEMWPIDTALGIANVAQGMYDESTGDPNAYKNIIQRENERLALSQGVNNFTGGNFDSGPGAFGQLIAPPFSVATAFRLPKSVPHAVHVLANGTQKNINGSVALGNQVNHMDDIDSANRIMNQQKMYEMNMRKQDLIDRSNYGQAPSSQYYNPMQQNQMPTSVDVAMQKQAQALAEDRKWRERYK